MSSPAVPEARLAVAPLEPGRLRHVVGILSYTEIVSWGVLFYAFTVLATSIEDAEGWPLTHLMAVFTVTQLVAAGCQGLSCGLVGTAGRRRAVDDPGVAKTPPVGDNRGRQRDGQQEIGSAPRPCGLEERGQRGEHC